MYCEQMGWCLIVFDCGNLIFSRLLFSFAASSLSVAGIWSSRAFFFVCCLIFFCCGKLNLSRPTFFCLGNGIWGFISSVDVLFTIAARLNLGIPPLWVHYYFCEVILFLQGVSTFSSLLRIQCRQQNLYWGAYQFILGLCLPCFICA